MKTKDNKSQVQGNHYERLTIEPVKIIALLKLDWFRGEVIKYVSRFPCKNGVIDLNKAIHVLSMYKELVEPEDITDLYNNSPLYPLIDKYVNQFFPNEKPIYNFKNPISAFYNLREAIKNTIKGNIVEAISSIDKLKYVEYDEL